ncbi:MAG: ATP-binding protein [Alphaproteobacteria bacterium]|nr:ATP-binding protein [Alphaproteobacteria bacterium]
MRTMATQHELKLLYDSPGEILFRGDEALIRRLVLNLLDNSIKHTPAGGTVQVNLKRRDGGCEVIVADTGTGISAEAQPHIFERFYRADKARSRAVAAGGSGAGLGLSIARWIAETHGGSLWLQNSDSKGSTFIASLPAGPAPPRR